jgi:hypothetical protein
MNVADVIGRLEQLRGTAVEIDGFLVYIDRHCYIAPTQDSWQKTDEAILVLEADVPKRLNAIVPGWVGGPSYQDDVTITGVIDASDHAPFPAVLDRVSHLILKREDEVFRVV